MDTGEARSFAYQGFLELNGAPTSATHDFQFALFTAPDADTSCLGSAALTSCGVWAEAHDAVPVSSGRFSVRLGTGTGDVLSDAILNNASLYLAIAVRPAGSGGAFSVLPGLTQLAAVPWASRAAAAKNYTVSGHLTAASAAITGAALVGSLDADQAIRGESLEATQSVSGGTVEGGRVIAGIPPTDTGARLNVEGPVRLFGATTEVFNGAAGSGQGTGTQTAATDGFVLYTATRGSGSHLRVNGESPIGTVLSRYAIRVEAGEITFSGMFPVKKGETWRVKLDPGSTATNLTVRFVALGQ